MRHARYESVFETPLATGRTRRPATLSGPWLAVLVWLFSLLCGAAQAEPVANKTITLTATGSVPQEGRRALDAAELETLKQAVKAAPRERSARFELVKGLLRSGKLEEALSEAKAWRTIDAYNLVVVRLIGDILTELGRKVEARRAYSAVVELLPEDPEAQRALATVLKQGGDLRGAYDRLKAAAALRPKDTRIGFELADAAQRLDKNDEARALFAAIAQNPETPQQVRYPAQLRLAALDGGKRADIQVYLSWDTDRTDVDLWVTNPAGQRVSYKRKKGKFGGQLYDDVTSGFGPESFTAKTAEDGVYAIQVNFYGTDRRAFREARGEVVVVTNQGTPNEKRHVLPYRLFRPGQTVAVARIQVR